MLVVAAVWWLRRPPDGFLTGIAPIDGSRSVFTMRANYSNGPSRAWIGVVDADLDRVLWSRELPGETYSIHARHGLTVSGQQVTVKVHDTESTARVLAFDLATGEPRWTSDAIAFQPSEYPDMLHVVDGDRPYDDGRQVLHGDHDRVTARLVARDAATGATQWSRDLPGHGVRELLFSPHAVLVRDTAWTFVRRSDGSVARELDGNGDACIDGDGRFVSWDDDALVRIDLGDPAAPAQAQPLPSVGRTLGCGTHGEQLVFTVAHPWERLEQRSFEVLAVAGDPAAIAWRVDLGGWEPSAMAQNRDNAGPDAAPNRGRLAVFVPLVLDAHGVDELKLAVIDVANGVLAWESALRAELLHFQAYRGSGSQHFLSNGSRIVAIDGASGRLTAAVDVVHQTSLSFHAVGGKLWIFSMDWHRMNELPWAVLDGQTLAILARGNEALQTTDATQQAAAWLGVPAGFSAAE